MSLEFKIINKVGGSWFKFIIFSIPAPILTPIKSCGAIPINDPKKKFLTFISNKTGKIFDIENANYIPKPSIIPLNLFMKKFNIKAEEAIFFEDIPQNLVNPKKVGFQTVLIKNNSHPDNNTDILKKEIKQHNYVDHITYDISSLLEQIYLDISNEII